MNAFCEVYVHLEWIEATTLQREIWIPVSLIHFVPGGRQPDDDDDENWNE
jgi:hypothetical protein